MAKVNKDFYKGDIDEYLETNPEIAEPYLAHRAPRWATSDDFMEDLREAANKTFDPTMGLSMLQTVQVGLEELKAGPEYRLQSQKLREAIDGTTPEVDADQPDAHAKVDLWRGMRDLGISNEFERQGGTEMATMSTTTALKVALSYATVKEADSGHALIFKLRTDSFLGRGASLSWISAFADEEETIFPPLSYLKPTEKRQEMVATADGRAVTVVEVVPVL